MYEINQKWSCLEETSEHFGVTKDIKDIIINWIKKQIYQLTNPGNFENSVYLK